MKRIKGKLEVFSEIIFFIFILAVLLYSIYHVLSYFKIIKFESWGVSPCGDIPYGESKWECSLCGNWCDWGEDWCEWGRQWCECFCHWPCPTPTPTLGPSPTPTPLPSATPTPTPPPCVTPTPTPTPAPEPTATPTPTPEPKPEAPGPGGPPGPPVCTSETPDAPTLLSVTPTGPGEVELVWTRVANATHYSISYGPSSGNYLYGVSNTGSVTSFRVGNLDPAINYCFAVRAVNDCAPGPLSNEICQGEVLGKVLGVTTLADTGSFDKESLELILFTIGCLCLGIGLNFLSPKKSVLSPLAKN